MPNNAPLKELLLECDKSSSGKSGSGPKPKTAVGLGGGRSLWGHRLAKDSTNSTRLKVKTACTEENDYLISYCPYYSDNSLVAGVTGSGHAFKMLGSLGNVIKDIILQKADTDEQKLLAHILC